MKPSRIAKPLAAAVALTLAPTVAAQSDRADPAHFFHPAQVSITAGPFRHSIELGADYVLAHDIDRLLAPFRDAAGLEPKAERYGNWESSGLDGHSAGHFLSAYATLSLATGNPTFETRLDYALDELEACQAAHGNGYVGGVRGGEQLWTQLAEGTIDAQRFSLNGAWVPWYNLHKTYAGLRDAWLVGGKQKARDILLKLADWTHSLTADLSDEQMQQMLYAEHGGMNEIFASLYQETGDKRHLDLAYRFSHREMLDPLKQHEDQLTGFHANTQIPKVVGFQQIALAAKDEAYADASRFFWDTVVHHRSVAIGGNSVREHFHPADDFSSMVESREGPETCNTHNMLRLTEKLFQQKPSSDYADYYERALYNHILSAQHPETGGLVYFTPMRPRHYRVYSVAEDAFWCCVGSGIENPGRYSEFVYAKRGDELYVNLFLPSALDWKEQSLRLSQATDFPNTPATALIIHQAPETQLTLKIRQPSWLAAPATLSLNGKKLSPSVGDDGYLAVTRTWSQGDTLRLELPMQVRAEALPDGSPYYAFHYGPVVLAAKTGDEDMPGLFAGPGRMEHIAPGPYLPLDEAPMLVGAADQLAERVSRVPGESLRFTLGGDIRPAPEQPIELQPFNTVHESRYTVYWRHADEAEYESISERLAEAEKRKLALAARRIDSVSPGEQQSEVEHTYRGAEARSGALLGKRYREASQWFEYTLDPAGTNQALELALTTFGSEWAKDCLVKVNGDEIGRIQIRSNAPDQFVENVFPLPDSVDAQQPLVVRIEAAEGNATPMIFDLTLRHAAL